MLGDILMTRNIYIWDLAEEWYGSWYMGAICMGWYGS